MKAEAVALIAAGPPAWDKEAIDSKRYTITNLLDDLRDPRSDMEAAATLGALHEALGDFYLRTKNQWSAANKHIPRRLNKEDPALGLRWETAFLNAYKGQRHAVVNLAEEVLLPYGGLLFADYRQDAPPEKRLKAR